MPPKFAIVTPKCSRCTQSVYPMEQVEYDKKLYHQTCFKCLECKSTLNLSRIAQINNDLYCKTCFMRIFTKDGKYTGFAGQAAETRRATVSGVAPGPTAAPLSNLPSSSYTPIQTRTAPLSPTSSMRSRTATFSVESTSTQSTTPNTKQVDTPEQRELIGIFESISARNIEKTKELVLNSSLGIDILFKQNAKGITAVEYAFSGFNNAKNVGNMLLNLISSQLTALRLSSGTASGSQVSKPSLSPTDLASPNSPSPQTEERAASPEALVA